ncbi:hypothetical protein ACS0TY_024137 [Phlomoides rotata]
MEYESTGSLWPPFCWCKSGQMLLFQAGTEKNPRRYFYKCPRNIKHPHNFIWCDVWHQGDPPSLMPEFLRYHNPEVKYYNPQSSSVHQFSQNMHQFEGGSNVSLCSLRIPYANQFTYAFRGHYFYLGCVSIVVWSIFIAYCAYSYGRVSR